MNRALGGDRRVTPSRITSTTKSRMEDIARPRLGSILMVVRSCRLSARAEEHRRKLCVARLQRADGGDQLDQ